MLVEEKLKRATFKHIESELYAYHDTLKEIDLIRNMIINDTPEYDNVEQGKNSARTPGDPTGKTVTRLLTNKRLQRLEEIAGAIQQVYTNLPKTHQELIRIKYWTKPQTKTWEGIAQELHVSRRQAFYWRDEIVNSIAEVLGWR